MIPLIVWYAIAAFLLALVIVITSWIWIPLLVIFVAVCIGGVCWIWDSLNEWNYNRINRAHNKRLNEIFKMLQNAKTPEDIAKIKNMKHQEEFENIGKRWGF